MSFAMTSVTSPWRMAMWTIIAILLLLPLAAMRFTGEVAWTGSDFVVAAILLIGGGLAYEVIARTIRNRSWRKILGMMLVAVIALVWAQGAVGIF